MRSDTSLYDPCCHDTGDITYFSNSFPCIRSRLLEVLLEPPLSDVSITLRKSVCQNIGADFHVLAHQLIIIVLVYNVAH